MLGNYVAVSMYWKFMKSASIFLARYFFSFLSCFVTSVWLENYFLPTASKKQWFHISQSGGQSTAFLFIAKRGYNNKKTFAGGILPIKCNNILKQILKVEIYEFVFLCQSMYFHMLTSKCRLSADPLIIKTAAVKSKWRILTFDISLSCDYFFFLKFNFHLLFFSSKILITLFLRVPFSEALRPIVFLFCSFSSSEINSENEYFTQRIGKLPKARDSIIFR